MLEDLIAKVKQIFDPKNHQMHALVLEERASKNDFHFQNIMVNRPVPSGREILVKVQGVSVNPVDVKLSANPIPDKRQQFPILGFDAVGTVESVGDEATNFAVGDRVFYAGDQKQSGANAEFQLVDERLVGLAPVHLSDAESASIPLTGITAYEILVDHFGLTFEPQMARDKTIFIINGAGGVGSMLIQLAKYLGMTVITTASRPESVEWVKSLGADIVMDYHQDLKAAFKKRRIEVADYIAILKNTDQYIDLAVDLVKPFGHITSIDETDQPLPLVGLKNKAAQFSWEFMFAKANFNQRMAEQGRALRLLATLLDGEVIKATATTQLLGMTPENMTDAYQTVASGKTIGKVVITGSFDQLVKD